MSTTPKLGIPLVSQQQSTPEITHNEAILLMSFTQTGVESFGDNAPPVSPSEGDSYIVGTSPTGAWAGRANAIAIYYLNGWRFIPDVDSSGSIISMGPEHEGLNVFDKLGDAQKYWDGSAWVDVASVPGEPMQFGQRSISLNTTSIAVTAAADPTLATNADYVQVSGIFNPAPDGNNYGVTQNANGFTVTRSGHYRIEFWANAKSTTNSTQIAFKFAVNGVIGLDRRPKIYMRNSGEIHPGGAFGYQYFNAGDEITLHLASTVTANVTIEDAVFGANSLTNGPTNGEQYGAELLDQLNDVEIDSSLSDGQYLVYDAVSGNWINQYLPAAGVSQLLTVKTTANTGELPNWASWIADTSGGALSRAMPSSPSDGEEVTVYDVNENAATNNITLTVVGPTTISQAVINTDGESVKYRYDASGDQWDVVFKKAPSTGGGVEDYRYRLELSTAGETAGSQNITDVSPHEQPLTVVGNTNIQADGSIYFDGDGDYITVPNSCSVSAGDDFDLAIEIELNWDGDGDADQNILNKRNATVSNEYWVRLQGGAIQLVTFVSLSPDVNIIGDTLTAGVWYNVKVTRTAGVWEVLLDDVSQGTQAQTSTPDPNLDVLNIGHDAGAAGRQFKGYIRKLSIYKEFK